MPREAPRVAPRGADLSVPAAGEVPNAILSIRRVEIAGASVFGDEALRPYLNDLTGPAVPLPRINQARLDILRHYRSRGYVLSAVSVALADYPAQGLQVDNRLLTGQP